MDQPWECTTSPLTAFEEVAKNKLAPIPIILHLQPYLIACPWRRYLQCKRGHHLTLPDTKSRSVSNHIQIISGLPENINIQPRNCREMYADILRSHHNVRLMSIKNFQDQFFSHFPAIIHFMEQILLSEVAKMIILYILFFLHIFLQQLILGVKILNITL